jgi:FkbM family methyltransferase
MLHRISSLLPAPVIRFLGKLQYRVPWLRPLIMNVAKNAATTGTIRRGEGKGLTFDGSPLPSGVLPNPGFLAGTSEIDEQRLLSSLLRQGDVFYDLGANVGFYALIAARIVGPSGHVYAFEPSPEPAARIRRGAALNGFRNITVFEVAVSDENTKALFSNSGSVGAKMLEEQEAREGFEVEVRTIDVVTAEHKLRRPTVVMLDVEGAEIRALRGMASTLQAFRPSLMVEVHWLGEQWRDFVKEKLLPLGYRQTTYSGDEIPQDNSRFHAFLRVGAAQP